MDFIDFGSLIPVAAILATFGFAWLALRYYELRAENRRADRAYVVQSEEKKVLEKRLAVLERIVTDRGMQTAEQIDALRDSPQLSRQTEAAAAEKGGRA